MIELKLTTHKNDLKMEGFKSLNTSVIHNSFCEKMRVKKDSICHKCYAINVEKRYKHLKANLKSNFNFLT